MLTCGVPVCQAVRLLEGGVLRELLTRCDRLCTQPTRSLFCKHTADAALLSRKLVGDALVARYFSVVSDATHTVQGRPVYAPPTPAILPSMQCARVPCLCEGRARFLPVEWRAHTRTLGGQGSAAIALSRHRRPTPVLKHTHARALKHAHAHTQANKHRAHARSRSQHALPRPPPTMPVRNARMRAGKASTFASIASIMPLFRASFLPLFCLYCLYLPLLCLYLCLYYASISAWKLRKW
jgi:hypothetical protein